MASAFFHQQFDLLEHITIEVRFEIEAVSEAINMYSQKQGKNLLIVKRKQGFQTKGICNAVKVKWLVRPVGFV